MFGMSERVGMMAVGDQEQEIFLGREIRSAARCPSAPRRWWTTK